MSRDGYHCLEFLRSTASGEVLQLMGTPSGLALGSSRCKSLHPDLFEMRTLHCGRGHSDQAGRPPLVRSVHRAEFTVLYDEGCGRKARLIIWLPTIHGENSGMPAIAEDESPLTPSLTRSATINHRSERTSRRAPLHSGELSRFRVPIVKGGVVRLRFSKRFIPGNGAAWAVDHMLRSEKVGTDQQGSFAYGERASEVSWVGASFRQRKSENFVPGYVWMNEIHVSQSPWKLSHLLTLSLKSAGRSVFFEIEKIATVSPLDEFLSQTFMLRGP